MWVTLTFPVSNIFRFTLQVTRFGGVGASMIRPDDTRRGGRYGAQLADAGWHCSWCFPTLADFAVKAASYAHVEHNDESILNRDWLQQAVCEGKDLAGRWGEFRHWEDMIRHLPGEFMRQRTVIGLPSPLLDFYGSKRFGTIWKHLMPGQCMRRDYAGSYRPPQ